MKPLLNYYKLDNDLFQETTFCESLFDHFGFENGRLIVGSEEEISPLLTFSSQYREKIFRKHLKLNGGYLFSESAIGQPERLDSAVFENRHSEGSPWKTIHSVQFQREPGIFVGVLRPLLSEETRVWLVDPYFSCTPKRGKPDRFVSPLKALMKEWTELNPCLTNTPGKIIIITNQEVGSLLDWSQDRSNVPDHIVIRPIKAEEKFHNRFVLTDKGGVMFAWGLDSTNSKPDVAVRLNQQAWSDVFNLYKKYAPAE